MSEELNEQQIVEELRAAPPIVLSAGSQEPPTRIPPPPNDVWSLPGGTAWVYYGEGNAGLTRPVILADGFNSGPSTPEFLWNGLDHQNYGFLSALRARGRDVILLGFTERSASILDNAEAAVEAIHHAIANRAGDHRLAVGGFSMGGLVTRYALARMETQRMDHQTDLYFSYDSPHRGAYIPVSLQAFAHYIRRLDSRFSDQINSDASRQLLRWHLAEWDGTVGVSDERSRFLDALKRVGDWPRIPRLIGVANGLGDGTGNGVEAGASAVRGRGLGIAGTDLRTQPSPEEALAATLRVITLQKPDVSAPGLPAVDGAPGGTLEGFGILADALNKIFGLGVNNAVREHCFVPSVSAVAIRDIDTEADLNADISAIPEAESELDEFKLASAGGVNEGHTKMTEELCGWLLERLP